MKRLSRNEKRQLTYQYLSGTDLSAEQKRKYRDWSVERIEREIKGLESKGQIQTKSSDYRIKDILKVLNKNIKTGGGKIEYRPIEESRKRYLDRYTHVVAYETGKKGNRKTEYVTITDNFKLSKAEIIRRVKDFIKAGGSAKYNYQQAVVGSIRIDESYINENVAEGDPNDTFEDLDEYD